MYAVDCYSTVYSHNDEELNCRPVSFKFNKDDIIIITVDMVNRIILWEKKNSRDKFVNFPFAIQSMSFDASLGYHPFVMSNGHGDVEIIHYLQK